MLITKFTMFHPQMQTCKRPFTTRLPIHHFESAWDSSSCWRVPNTMKSSMSSFPTQINSDLYPRDDHNSIHSCTPWAKPILGQVTRHLWRPRTSRKDQSAADTHQRCAWAIQSKTSHNIKIQVRNELNSNPWGSMINPSSNWSQWLESEDERQRKRTQDEVDSSCSLGRFTIRKLMDRRQRWIVVVKGC